MAIELKATIELKDTTAVEFRCARGYASIRKLGSNIQVSASCGNSNCSSRRKMADEPALQKFFRSIAQYGAKENPCSLRLHVEALEEFPNRGTGL